jgi:hypothetical protein
MTRFIGDYITLLLRYYSAAIEQIIAGLVVVTVATALSLLVLVANPLITLIQLAVCGDMETSNDLIVLKLKTILGEDK